MPKKEVKIKKLRPKGFCWSCQEETLFKKGSTVVQYISGKKMHLGRCEQCNKEMTVMAPGDSVPDRVESKKEAKERLENKKKKIVSGINTARQKSKKKKRSDEYKEPKKSKIQERIDALNKKTKKVKK